MSDIKKLREEIDKREEAVILALYGFNDGSSHQKINARMDILGQLALQVQEDSGVRAMVDFWIEGNLIVQEELLKEKEQL